MTNEDRRALEAEADRLALLRPDTQDDYIAMYRHLARSPKLTAAERQEARRKAAGLARLLRPRPRRRRRV